MELPPPLLLPLLLSYHNTNYARAYRCHNAQHRGENKAGRYSTNLSTLGEQSRRTGMQQSWQAIGWSIEAAPASWLNQTYVEELQLASYLPVAAVVHYAWRLPSRGIIHIVPAPRQRTSHWTPKHWISFMNGRSKCNLDGVKHYY